MSPFFVDPKKFEEALETIRKLESKTQQLEEMVGILEKDNGTLRSQVEKLTLELTDIKEKVDTSVLVTAKKDVENVTDEMIEKARDAVSEYLKPLTN